MKPANFNVKYMHAIAHDTITGATTYSATELTDPVISSATNIPPIYAKWAVSATAGSVEGNDLANPVALPFYYNPHTKNTFTSILLTGRELTITFPDRWNSEIWFMQRGGMP